MIPPAPAAATVAPRAPVPARARWWPPLVVWAATWTALVLLDDRLDLANEALLLVLASAVSALWWSALVSALAAGAAVLAFNVGFVPPRGSLTVDLHQHALLLGTMLAVGALVAWLVARLRRLAAASALATLRSEQLRGLAEGLRAADDPRDGVPLLRQSLERLTGAETALRLGGDAPEALAVIGTVGADEAAGLELCARSGRAMGPLTGRHEEQPSWYLPLRARRGSLGAVLVRPAPVAALGAAEAGERLVHAQALADQFAAALERGQALQAAAAARERAEAEALRTTLLSAIAHDHRTPLATIAGAAGALHDQADRLAPAQRRRLAATIVDEAGQLARMTENMLQLARLGVGASADGTAGATAALARDWQSAEELIGAVMARLRRRRFAAAADDPEHRAADAAARVQARVEPGLPLLHADGALIVQLLDNLVDNALKHTTAPAPIEIVARRFGDDAVIAVRDRGPGVPPADRERIFDAFRRGPAAADGASTRGAGVGLALARAIARAHGGELRLRSRAHGGSSFELVLPLPTTPAPGEPAAATAAAEKTR